MVGVESRLSRNWVTYQTYKKDGKVIFEGVLHKDTYQPLIDEKGMRYHWRRSRCTRQPVTGGRLPRARPAFRL
jgi:hypothetical protein